MEQFNQGIQAIKKHYLCWKTAQIMVELYPWVVDCLHREQLGSRPKSRKRTFQPLSLLFHNDCARVQNEFECKILRWFDFVNRTGSFQTFSECLPHPNGRMYCQWSFIARGSIRERACTRGNLEVLEPVHQLKHTDILVSYDWYSRRVSGTAVILGLHCQQDQTEFLLRGTHVLLIYRDFLPWSLHLHALPCVLWPILCNHVSLQVSHLRNEDQSD